MPGYVTKHLDLDGAAKDTADRDSEGWPDLELTLDPSGIALPPSEWQWDLVLRIGKAKTILVPESVAELRAWLDDELGVPRWKRRALPPTTQRWPSTSPTGSTRRRGVSAR